MAYPRPEGDLFGSTPEEPLECLDIHPDDPCTDDVEMRMNHDGTKWFPRCSHHYHAYLERMEEINRRYPYNAPSNFDPTYAGERWEDDY